eukprot:864000-Amphidinium_carterae.1
MIQFTATLECCAAQLSETASYHYSLRLQSKPAKRVTCVHVGAMWRSLSVCRANELYANQEWLHSILVSVLACLHEASHRGGRSLAIHEGLQASARLPTSDLSDVLFVVWWHQGKIDHTGKGARKYCSRELETEGSCDNQSYSVLPHQHSFWHT